MAKKINIPVTKIASGSYRVGSVSECLHIERGIGRDKSWGVYDPTTHDSIPKSTHCTLQQAVRAAKDLVTKAREAKLESRRIAAGLKVKKPVMLLGHSIGILRAACGRLENGEHGKSENPFTKDDLLFLIGEVWSEVEESLES